jgi:DNA processing protein
LLAPDWKAVDDDLLWLSVAGRRLLRCVDDDYPSRLREIGGAPPALFCIGDIGLLQLPQIGIVGARNASVQGLDNAHAFARELVCRGLVVTSGLAVGIDGAAHRGALDGGGGTIAVCGNGLDRVYPASHRKLAHTIAETGLLVSEFPPGTPPKPDHFPRRNRIISGLSLGVLVVEAARESGSLITARLATEQGREVFAIPGSIHNPLARGCHALIRDGARLVETVDDILVEIAPQLHELLAADHRPADGAGSEMPTAEPDVSAPAAHLLRAIGHESATFDLLLIRTGFDAATLSAVLMELELDGHVAAEPGGHYLRRNSR